MIKSFIVLAYRNVLRNRTSSLINILGLSIAVGCSLVAYTYIFRVHNPEWFHANKSEIHLVGHVTKENGRPKVRGTAPSLLGPALASDFPQIKRVVRVIEGRGEVILPGQSLGHRVAYVDPGFLEMFTFPLKYGDRSALSDGSGIVLSESSAILFFGQENPIGRTLEIKLGDEVETFVINGVAEPYYRRTFVSFSILVPLARRSGGEGTDAWATLNTSNYLQIEDLADVATVAEGLSQQIDRHRAASSKGEMAEAFVLEPFEELSFRRTGATHTAQILLAVIAAFLLAMSCFNYVNIAVASANRRLKEIGIRKVMGGDRRQLIGQFLTENALMCLFSILVGISIAQTFLLPAFNDITGSNLALDFQGRGGLWYYVSGLFIGLGLLSGAYPALYISAFQPVAILGSRMKLGYRNRITQTLLTFQFILAFITMITCLGIRSHAGAIEQRDWGYDKEHTLIVQAKDARHYAALRAAAEGLPDISQIAGSTHHVGKTRRRVWVVVNGDSIRAARFDVGAGYSETLRLRLVAGVYSEAPDAILINETFARRQGWDDGQEALGKDVQAFRRSYAVSGVVEDFHYRHWGILIEPAVLRIGKEAEFRFLTMRVRPGAGARTAAVLRETSKLVSPIPLDLYFQDQVFDNAYGEIRGLVRMLAFSAMMALLISCSGLFGLTSQHLASRLKEISIRKILGATLANATFVIFRRFLVLMGIACLVAAPIGFKIRDTLIGAIYKYRAEVGPFPFLIAVGLVLLTAVLTVMTQVRQLSTADPVEILRNE